MFPGRNRLLLILILLGTNWWLAAAPAANWYRVRSGEGVDVYQRHDHGTDLVWLRAETRVMAPQATLLALLMDQEHLSQWVSGYREVKVLQQEGVESFLVYVRIDAPFFLLDRDAVIASTVSWQDSVLRVGNRLDRRRYRSRPDTVPMMTLSGCWEAIAGSDSAVVIRYQGFADPAADPAWMINEFARDSLFQTFINLRREMQLPCYREAGRQLETRYRSQLQARPIPDACPVAED
ncbi:hypothetical protein GCM10011348_46960 [Marinobacterium nitratireducens]|uniref:START domain-containing protein n=1 Tax=Marinobacterium nitratireducens TaxID=518897 RepID=A0A918DZ76_9GAMM|nr:START domain-containing protein [Marinobacterium nitratireducens]GGO89364.1 hypothetical protein GCM10011348_46960 [Marinobacterium nitratireducens]